MPRQIRGPHNTNYSNFRCLVTGKEYKFEPGNSKSRERAKQKLITDHDALAITIGARLDKNPYQLSHSDWMHGGGHTSVRDEQPQTGNLRESIVDANPIPYSEPVNPHAAKIELLQDELYKHDTIGRGRNTEDRRRCEANLHAERLQSERWETDQAEKHARESQLEKAKPAINRLNSELDRAIRDERVGQDAISSLRQASDQVEFSDDPAVLAADARLSHWQNFLAEEDPAKRKELVGYLQETDDLTSDEISAVTHQSTQGIEPENAERGEQS